MVLAVLRVVDELYWFSYGDQYYFYHCRHYAQLDTASGTHGYVHYQSGSECGQLYSRKLYFLDCGFHCLGFLPASTRHVLVGWFDWTLLHGLSGGKGQRLKPNLNEGAMTISLTSLMRANELVNHLEEPRLGASKLIATTLSARGSSWLCNH